MVTEARKILGQSRPSVAGTAEALFAVPAGKEVVSSTLTMTNVSNTRAHAKLYVVPSGGSPSEDNVLYHELPVTGHDTFKATIGLTLAAGDSVMVESDIANALTFQAFGAELSP